MNQVALAVSHTHHILFSHFIHAHNNGTHEWRKCFLFFQSIECECGLMRGKLINTYIYSDDDDSHLAALIRASPFRSPFVLKSLAETTKKLWESMCLRRVLTSSRPFGINLNKSSLLYVSAIAYLAIYRFGIRDERRRCVYAAVKLWAYWPWQTNCLFIVEPIWIRPTLIMYHYHKNKAIESLPRLRFNCFENNFLFKHFS